MTPGDVAEAPVGIKVLIADDSPTVQRVLATIIAGQRDMVVVGVARTGREAVDLAQRLQPDVITMDVYMPDMDGYEATARIMTENPRPIVVVSSSIDSASGEAVVRALGEGALAAVRKPALDDGAGIEQLVRTVRAMAGVRTLRKRRASAAWGAAGVGPSGRATSQPSPVDSAHVCLIAIGSSTGGPQTLARILGRLGRLPVPMIIAQHISPGFTGGLVDWLSQVTQLPVSIARQAQHVLPGNVYFAPDEAQTRIVQVGGMLRAHITDAPARHGFRPSADVLFESVAECLPGRAMGIILTGMGVDGAEGLLQMHRAGCVTLGQDEASCVVFGMPAAAGRLGAVGEFADPEGIADRIGRLAGPGHSPH